MRGCLWGLISLLSPRIIILGLVFFTDYLGQAIDSVLWLILGFLFLPITTIAYAVAVNEAIEPAALWWGLIGVGIALDLGMLGGGSWGLQVRERRVFKRR